VGQLNLLLKTILSKVEAEETRANASDLLQQVAIMLAENVNITEPDDVEVFVKKFIFGYSFEKAYFLAKEPDVSSPTVLTETVTRPLISRIKDFFFDAAYLQNPAAQGNFAGHGDVFFNFSFG